MIDRTIAKQGLRHAGLAVLYVIVVVSIMSRAEKIFGPDDQGILAPIAFLLLFVVSAAVMGALVFGKPLMMYIDGKKREAVTLAMSTVGSLAAITVLILFAVALSNR